MAAAVPKPIPSANKAREVYARLIEGEDLELPEVNFDSDNFRLPEESEEAMRRPLRPLTNEELTTREVGGDGTFDAVMAGFQAHLKEEYAKNRISGAEYTKAFIALADGGMSNAVQFLLGRDQAYWQSARAQIEAITAKVQMETAKLQFAAMKYEMLTAKANYALTKLKLATEDRGYEAANFQLEKLMPEQYKLMKEQVYAQKAQTSNYREDPVTNPLPPWNLLKAGVPVEGLLGVQKKLQEQQIEGFKRNAEASVAKMFVDGFSVIQSLADDPDAGATTFGATNLQMVMNKTLAQFKNENGKPIFDPLVDREDAPTNPEEET